MSRQPARSLTRQQVIAAKRDLALEAGRKLDAERCKADGTVEGWNEAEREAIHALLRWVEAES